MRALPRSTALLAAVAVVVAAALVATVVARGREAAPRVPPVSWLGLVGGPRAPVPNGQRMIVVLHAPSVAQRLAHARFATEAQERSWSSQALAAQAQVLTPFSSAKVWSPAVSIRYVRPTPRRCRRRSSGRRSSALRAGIVRVPGSRAMTAAA